MTKLCIPGNQLQAPLFGLSLLLGLSLATAASAHHSTSEYDTSKQIKLAGTVKEFQWTNPHSWIELDVPDKHGAITEWGIEFGTPVINIRHGWKRTDLKPGDHVYMVIYPMRDGSAHGTLATITLADGRTLDGAAVFVAKEIAKDLPPPPAGGASATPQNK
jgi:hypothetical protein